jgi:hypothetical protein
MPRAVSAVRAVLDWPTRSHQGARRNAMVASTLLAERRRERLDAEAFLAQHALRRASAQHPPAATQHGNRRG